MKNNSEMSYWFKFNLYFCTPVSMFFVGMIADKTNSGEWFEMVLAVGRTFLQYFLKKFGRLKKGCNFAVRFKTKYPEGEMKKLFFERLK